MYHTQMAITHSCPVSDSNLSTTVSQIFARRALSSFVRYFTHALVHYHIFSRAPRTCFKFSRAPRTSVLFLFPPRSHTAPKFSRPHAYYFPHFHTYARSLIKFFRAPHICLHYFFRAPSYVYQIFSARPHTFISVLTRAPSYIYQIFPRAPRTFISVSHARYFRFILFHVRALFSLIYFSARPSYSHLIFPRALIHRFKFFARRPYIFQFFIPRAPTVLNFSGARPFSSLKFPARAPAVFKFSGARPPSLKFARPPFPCRVFIFAPPPVSTYSVYSPRVITTLRRPFTLSHPLPPP